VSMRQVLLVIRDLLFAVQPRIPQEKVCMECKRQQHVCVLVTGDQPCLGPVTQTGCGAICPRVGRDCYGCFGPAENANTQALGTRFAGLGLMPEAIAKRFQFINSGAKPFADATDYWMKKS